MAELKCPHCGQAFTVDDAELGSIIAQIRDAEFEKELDKKAQMLTEHLKEKHDLEITRLKSTIDGLEDKKKIAVMEAVTKAEKEKQELENAKHDLENELLRQKEKDRFLLEQKDEQIAYYKDMKTKLSTKMVGESLERFCETEFEKLRAAAFRNAQFGKDNDARSGSKGDFIFREADENGVEIISIMFEMKNEMDETSTKHKNEDFFKELDKDRNEKKCEYAVLVSLLESDNELYNNGIVDVSYRYPKMFVIRPQFFIPIISLLRNAAMNSLEYQKKLADVQNQQLDLFHFEENLALFKNSFADSFRKASDRFEDAIKGIDNAISALTKIRENLVKSENHLNTANNKLEDVSIKKLTKNAPSVRKMFEETAAKELPSGASEQ